MNSTHMTASDISASNQGFSVHKNSMFQATNSSFLQGASHVGGQTESNNYQQNRRIKIVSMNEESAFDNRKPDRLTIYRAKVFPERPLEPLRLEL